MKRVLVFCGGAAAAILAFAAEPIWWGFGGSIHEGVVRDDAGAPRGKLLSDNLRWYGPAVFTGCTYEYDCELSSNDEYVPTLNRFLRDKNAPPEKPVFGRKLVDGTAGADQKTPVAGAAGKPIKATFDFKRPCVSKRLNHLLGSRWAYIRILLFTE